MIFFILGGAIIGFLCYVYIVAPSPQVAINAKLKEIEHKKKQNKNKAQNIVTHAQKEAEEFLHHLKETIKRQEAGFKDLESSAKLKESIFSKKNHKIHSLKKFHNSIEKNINRLKEEITSSKGEQEKVLLEKLGLSVEDVKKQILEDLDNEHLIDETTFKKNKLMNAEESANLVAKGLILSSIQKYAHVSSVETKCEDIVVEKDASKGRIVGKNGCNINYIEELTGVNIIFNDKPNSILVYSPDLIKKNIARILITRLKRYSHIDKKLIDKEYKEAERIHTQDGVKEAKKYLDLLNLKNLPQELYDLAGKLKYRTSYGQNVLRHSYEVAIISETIATELNLDSYVAKFGGFFHDIGKSIDREYEGGHDELTKVILERNGYSYEIVHAAWTHHEAVPIDTPEAWIVRAADAISASRPGARHYSLDNYIQKIRALEETASSFDGIDKVFAINAGREVRIVIDPDEVNDKDSVKLMNSIAEKIEEELIYPGTIKIQGTRTTEAIDYAKVSK